MIKSVTAWKSKRTGETRYYVNHGTKVMRYTNSNLPKTAKSFMQTHPFEKTVTGSILFC